ncbi:zinc knuckle CX2CX4HX4C containing protein [Tanacetum coccineum]|uniref:Zinc knuckle CX2CX4HX4C containing protein n=1 Tax=Tanacetum coccineum TaxID=301880 RepID=A0ABQ5DLP1_9ASTR
MDNTGKESNVTEVAKLYKSVKANTIASKVTNIEGRVLPRRYTTYQEPIKDTSSNQAKSSGINSCGTTQTLDVMAAAQVKGSNPKTTSSFASVLQKGPIKKVVKLTELRNEEVVEGATIALPLDAVEEVTSRFTNTLYGYFIGKRLAFPLVENYVKNTWAKYGLKRVQLHDEFFLFQFETKEGMESVLENGPWLIRLVPLMLNIWTPYTDLKKAEIKKAPVWVKLHHVPIVAYSEVGLSLITTQIGRPIMLDSYTNNMCLSSWGRSTYARALIEVSAEKELMESIVIAILKGKEMGHSLATVEIKYEWKPPRCSTCAIFDHIDEKCPKIQKEDMAHNEGTDGFVEVKKKKAKTNKPHKQKPIGRVKLTKPPPKIYRRVEKGEASKALDQNHKTVKASTESIITKPSISLINSFSALDDEEEEVDQPQGDLHEAEQVLNVSDSEVDEEIVMDDRNGIRQPHVNIKGASTPVDGVSND